MTIYSLYIFDRHCECVYYQDWHRTRPVRPSAVANFKPGVHRLPLAPTSGTDASANVRESIFSNRTSTHSGDVPDNRVGANGPSVMNGLGPRTGAGGTAQNRGLPFDEEAKLVYGVVLSMKNMVKKLSGRDELFTSYRTPAYKLHLFETPTSYRFVLLSDPSADSLRFVLRQLYTGPFVDYVVRNPVVQMDSRTEGVDNDQFRAAIDRHIRGLSMFGT
ncbi:TRAPP subunit bet5 [Saitozyma podzolica]|uniref:Trafficking protein particle complex subunit n=1 Tax=Saitozyma podzolica TaxID=1890683 RepID=A0A427YTZ6_9TREE|nr:TRAPP subunit bet5 [Saitozyma podzolica]